MFVLVFSHFLLHHCKGKEHPITLAPDDDGTVVVGSSGRDVVVLVPHSGFEKTEINEIAQTCRVAGGSA